MTFQVTTDSTASGPSEFAINVEAAVWSRVPRVVSRELPVAVSRAQAYYWSHAWQEAERESLQALEQGDAQRFDDPADAIRWLLDSDVD